MEVIWTRPDGNQYILRDTERFSDLMAVVPRELAMKACEAMEYDFSTADVMRERVFLRIVLLGLQKLAQDQRNVSQL